jgi:diamine N-acetyltransferase
MINFTIQRVQPEDIIDLQNIARQTFQETYAAGNTAENMAYYLKHNLSIDHLKRELENKNSEFYFAKSGGKILGYLKINFGPSPTELTKENCVEIERIYVCKEFQGKKIGHQLLVKAIDLAKGKGASFIWLGVWEHNPKAFLFYQRHGFEVFDQHVFVLGDDEQMDFLMRLKL